MSEKEDTVLPASNSDLTDTDEKGSVVDMMLGKSSEKVIDSNIILRKNVYNECKYRRTRI